MADKHTLPSKWSSGLWIRPDAWEKWQACVVTPDHKDDGRKLNFRETAMFIRAYWKCSSNKSGALMCIIARALTFRLKPSQAPLPTETEKTRPNAGLIFLFDTDILNW